MKSKLLILATILSLCLQLTTYAQEQDYEVISIDNVSQLEEVDRFGRPTAFFADWSPDKRLIAWGSEEGVWLYNKDTPDVEPVQVSGSSGRVFKVAFSPNGRQIAFGNDKVLIVVDVQSNTVIHIAEEHAAPIFDVDFNPDGSLIASGAQDNTIILWNTETWESVDILEGHDSGVSSVTFSPDGTRLFSGSMNGSLLLWDIDSGTSTQFLEGHQNMVLDVAFSPDGTSIASVSWEDSRNFLVWDVASGAEIAAIDVDVENGLGSIAYNTDGTVVATADASLATDAVDLWDTTSWSLIQRLERDSGGNGGYVSVDFTDNHTLTAFSSNGQVVEWNTETFTTGSSQNFYTSPVSSLAISPDSTKLLTGSRDGSIALWDIHSQEVIGRYNGSGRIRSLSFSPDGSSFVSAAYQGGTMLWSAASDEPLWIANEGNENWSADFSPDGANIVIGSRGPIILVDAVTGDVIRRFGPERYPATGTVAFSPDGTRVLGGYNDVGEVLVWDRETGQQVSYFQLRWVQDTEFDSSGQWIVSGSQRDGVYLWDASTGTSLLRLDDTDLTVHEVSISPDNQLVVSGLYNSQGSMRLYDTETGQIVHEVPGITDDVVFSPDGRFIMSTHNGAIVSMWTIP